eukprot:1902635-Prymnesium_polylepis.1
MQSAFAPTRVLRPPTGYNLQSVFDLFANCLAKLVEHVGRMVDAATCQRCEVVSCCAIFILVFAFGVATRTGDGCSRR